VYIEIQDSGIPSSARSTPSLRVWRATRASRWSRPVTPTTSASTTPTRTSAVGDPDADVLSNRTGSSSIQGVLPQDGAEMAIALPDSSMSAVSLEIAERCGGSSCRLARSSCRASRCPTVVADGVLGALVPRGHDAPLRGRPPAGAEDRLRFELDVIEEMGFSSYFLIVWDYIRWRVRTVWRSARSWSARVAGGVYPADHGLGSA